jgi:hypothetical protein
MLKLTHNPKENDMAKTKKVTTAETTQQKKQTHKNLGKSPSDTGQALRSAKNKRVKIEREARRQKVGKVLNVKRGTARAARAHIRVAKRQEREAAARAKNAAKNAVVTN